MIPPFSRYLYLFLLGFITNSLLIRLVGEKDPSTLMYVVPIWSLCMIVLVVDVLGNRLTKKKKRKRKAN